jgi:hypothetical protein
VVERFLDLSLAPAGRGMIRVANAKPGEDGRMSIEVEHLESWIGSEARGRSGDKLGKIDDVYFAGAQPVAIDIRSGLGGRKHHAGTLTGATVSKDGIQLAIDEDQLVATDGGALTRGQIAALYGQDDQLRGAPPEQLESWHERERLRKEAEEARVAADKLEAEARRRAEDEEKAAAVAGDAEVAAEKARQEHEEAEARAREAEAAADPTQQS